MKGFPHCSECALFKIFVHKIHHPSILSELGRSVASGGFTSDQNC